MTLTISQRALLRDALRAMIQAEAHGLIQPLSDSERQELDDLLELLAR